MNGDNEFLHHTHYNYVEESGVRSVLAHIVCLMHDRGSDLLLLKGCLHNVYHLAYAF